MVLVTQNIIVQNTNKFYFHYFSHLIIEFNELFMHFGYYTLTVYIICKYIILYGKVLFCLLRFSYVVHKLFSLV